MATLRQVREMMLDKLVQHIPHNPDNGAKNLLTTDEMIPIYGVIFNRRFSEDGGAVDLYFYLAAETGEVLKHKHIGRSINDEVFNVSEATKQVSELLNLPSEEITLMDGGKEYKHKGDLCGTRWKFLCVPLTVFEEARKPKKVSVVMDWMSDCQIHRMVAPCAVRIRKAKFDFDAETANVQFAAKHNNSIEYLTEDGVKVFDNRLNHIGVAYSKDGGEEPIVTRVDALKDFLYAIWRGSKASRYLDKQTEQLRDFAGYALHRIALDSEIPRKEGGLVAEGITLLYGKACFPLKEILEEGIRYSNFNVSKRMLFQDVQRMEEWDEQEGRLDPRYVVITDKLSKK